MNFRACSSVSRHVLCLICVIFYDGSLIFSWLNWSILYIFQFICYTKKWNSGFRSLFFALFSLTLCIFVAFCLPISFFYLWTFEYRALGFVCIFFFWAHICMLYYILMLYFRIFAHIFAVQMEYAVISFEFIVGYLP